MAQAPQLIPQPVSLKTKTGHFALTKETRIIIPADNAECKRLGDLLAGMLAAVEVADDKTTALSIDASDPKAAKNKRR